MGVPISVILKSLYRFHLNGPSSSFSEIWLIVTLGIMLKLAQISDPKAKCKRQKN